MLVFCTLALSSCSASERSSNKIVTSFYPLHYAVEYIAGDDFNVENVTPVGAEPHDIELSPQKTLDILEAKAIFVMGDGFQPAIEKTAKSRDGNTFTILDEVLGESSDGVDPHIWLDPVLYKKAVQEITKNLISINPEKKKDYEQRRDELTKKLDTLDAQYKETFSDCRTKTFITSHDAFSRLAKRYGLVQESIAGISPDNEPSPQRLSDLSALAKKNNIDVIFTEDLVSKRVANSLSSEAGLETKTLSPLEGLTQSQNENGVNYFDVMEDNLSTLSSALGCSP